MIWCETLIFCEWRFKMSKKYELQRERGQLNFRIKALRDIPRHGVRAGDLGGTVACEYNLSQDGDCWIGYDACAFNMSRIEDNAFLGGRSVSRDFSLLKDNAVARGDTRLRDYTEMSSYAQTRGKVFLRNNARMTGHSFATGEVFLRDDCIVDGYSFLSGNVQIADNAHVCLSHYRKDDPDTSCGLYAERFGEKIIVGGNSFIGDYVTLEGNVSLTGNAKMTGYAILESFHGGWIVVGGNVQIGGLSHLFGCFNISGNVCMTGKTRLRTSVVDREICIFGQTRFENAHISNDRHAKPLPHLGGNTVFRNVTLQNAVDVSSFLAGAHPAFQSGPAVCGRLVMEGSMMGTKKDVLIDQAALPPSGFFQNGWMGVPSNENRLRSSSLLTSAS